MMVFLKKRAGYIFPLILLATLSVGLFVATVGQLQLSHKKQFNHLDEYQHAFNIAYSALVEVLADLKSSRWSNRSFKSAPMDYSENLYSGTYNLRVQDHAAEQHVFNVKIRVVYRAKAHLFYWRLKYEPSLLDFDTLVISKFFGQFGDSADPGYIASLDGIVDEMLEKRRDKRDKIKEIVEAINIQPNPGRVLRSLGAIEEEEINAVAESDKTRPAAQLIVLEPGPTPARGILELIEEIEGADTRTIQEVISSLPLTDIYPGGIDVNLSLVREDIVVFFVRILQLPEISSDAAINDFSDIHSDSVRNRALGAARENDPVLIVGYPDGSFGPKDLIWRGHMGVVLERTAAIAAAKLADAEDISEAQRRRFQAIKSFCEAEKVKYLGAEAYVGMTIGEGLWVMKNLMKSIEQAQ